MKRACVNGNATAFGTLKFAEMDTNTPNVATLSNKYQVRGKCTPCPARLPFSSKYKFMCRIMTEAKDGADPIELAKGAPEQLHERCSARCFTGTAHEACCSLVRAYGHEGDVEVVWETWRGMRTRRITPMSIAKDCMVEALSTNGDPGAGYELIQEAMGDVTARPLMNAGRRSRRRREKGRRRHDRSSGSSSRSDPPLRASRTFAGDSRAATMKKTKPRK